MNYPGWEPHPHVSYPPPKKSFPVVPVVLGVGGLLFALAVLGGMKAFHAVKNNSAEAITVANSFIDNMGQHNYQAAQALFTPQVRARTPADSLKDIETLVEKHHGAFVNHGQPQWLSISYTASSINSTALSIFSSSAARTA